MLSRAHGSSSSWQRPAVFAGVIALHVVGFQLVSAYGGLGRIIEEAATTFTVVKLPTARDEPSPEPPPPVPLRQPRPFEAAAPEPLVDISGESAGAPTIAVRIDDGSGASAGGGATIAPPAIAPTPLTYRSRRSTDEYYPAASIRLGEEGAAVVRACVDENGALQGSPQVNVTSGHARLDAAAAAWTREALVFTPATENGVRVAACKAFRVRFTLRR